MDPQSIAQRLVARDELSLDMLKKGRWIQVDDSICENVIWIKAEPTISRNRKGDRVVECIEILHFAHDSRLA